MIPDETFVGADGEQYTALSPDDFPDFSEVDSTTVDSSVGAPA